MYEITTVFEYLAQPQSETNVNHVNLTSHFFAVADNDQRCADRGLRSAAI